MSDPLISVIVPNYNHAQFLPRSIGALLDQPVLPFEIIVVDDGSTDNSREVLEEFARKSPIVRVCPNEKNLGVNASMNRGIELARGDYVVFPGADDEVRPGLFANAVKMFRQYPQAGVCSGICELRCVTTGLTWFVGGGMPSQGGYLSPDDVVKIAQRGKLAINNQNAVFKKSALIEAGGWIPELRWFSDWFGGYVVGFRHGMCHVPEVLSNFYLRPRSYYNADARQHVERRAVMDHMVGLLESEKYADVAPRIRRSGFLGEFGWPMLRVVAGRRRHWRFLTPRFTARAVRRSGEFTSRRVLPNWLASLALKIFYGRGAKTQAPVNPAPNGARA